MQNPECCLLNILTSIRGTVFSSSALMQVIYYSLTVCWITVISAINVMIHHNIFANSVISLI